MKIRINKRLGIVTIDDGKRINVMKTDKWIEKLQQDIWFEQAKKELRL